MPIMDHDDTLIAIRLIIKKLNLPDNPQSSLDCILQPLYARLLLKFPKKNDLMAFLFTERGNGSFSIKYVTDVCKQDGFDEEDRDTYDRDYTVAEIKRKIYKIMGILSKLKRANTRRSHAASSGHSAAIATAAISSHSVATAIRSRSGSRSGSRGRSRSGSRGGRGTKKNNK